MIQTEPHVASYDTTENEDTNCSFPCACECVGEEQGKHNKTLGRKGENAAVAFLTQRGFTILERNWTCRYGEADIIAFEGSTLHFVEVKTRLSEECGFPCEAITRDRRRKYEVLAEIYLCNNDVPKDVSVTFDAISLIVTGPSSAFLRFHRNILTDDSCR